MNGCILNEAPIAVDFWKLVPNAKSKFIFFLSHMHADHTNGLSSSWRFPIYTSPINCKLAMAQFEFLEPILKPLELDAVHELPLPDGSFMNVTLINANHIPGSVMFMFQGKFGNILYTGDMRYYRQLKDHLIINNVINNDVIDVLYLDNTFCHPRYSFPSREEVREDLLKLIEKYPNSLIKIGIRKIGKEDLLEAIASSFSELILLYPSRYNQMLLLNRKDPYTTNPEASRIHVMDFPRVTKSFIESSNEKCPTIGILLTALYYNSDEIEPHRFSDKIFILPYSDHSSYPELIKLVSELKPRKVKAIVNNSNKKHSSNIICNNTNMSVFDQYLSSEKSTVKYSVGKRNSDSSGKRLLDKYKNALQFLTEIAVINTNKDENNIIKRTNSKKRKHSISNVSDRKQFSKNKSYLADTEISDGESHCMNDDLNMETSVSVDHLPDTSESVDHLTDTSESVDHLTDTSESVDHLTDTGESVDHLTDTSESIDHLTDTSEMLDHLTETGNSVDHVINKYNLKRQKLINEANLFRIHNQSRLKLIKEANNLCTELMEQEFKLEKTQNMKREILLRLFSNLCRSTPVFM